MNFYHSAKWQLSALLELHSQVGRRYFASAKSSLEQTKIGKAVKIGVRGSMALMPTAYVRAGTCSDGRKEQSGVSPKP